ncbi:MAG: TolC family protein [Bacteroidetes bacterium]|nr:TolC family protein [Bacteroidota bacterium]MBL6944096.1 TolC family protein [Bacteroidales bacterium]
MKIVKPLILTCLFLSQGYMFSQRTLTLDESMEIAGLNSPAIQKSRLNMEKNKEYLKAQLASLKSRFFLDVTPVSYSREQRYDERFSEWYTSENKGAAASFVVSQPIKLTDGLLTIRNDFGYQDNFSEANNTTYTDMGFNNYFYLQYDQPVFTYNRLKLNLDRIKLNLETATMAYAIEMLNMEYQVNQAFYAVYQKQTAVQIAEEEFANQKVSLEIIKSKVEAGLSAKEELLQAELNYATSESNVDNNRVDLENASDQFKLLIGMSLFDDIQVESDIDFKLIYVNPEKAIENGLNQRLELTQRNIDLKMSEFNLTETSSENEFRGDISLSVGVMGNNEYFADIYDKPTNSPSVGITFSIPLFDWGQRQARIKAAEIDIQSKHIDLEDQKNNIIINIRKTYRNLQNLVYQIEIARQNEKNAQLTYEINLERYQNGDLTSIDLQRFQNQLSDKKTRLVNALINYKLEIINMKVQSLWDFEKNISFIPQELQGNLSTEN